MEETLHARIYSNSIWRRAHVDVVRERGTQMHAVIRRVHTHMQTTDTKAEMIKRKQIATAQRSNNETIK